MNSLIIAGEVSGDLYGAALAKQLKADNPDMHIFAVGGDGLKKEADTFVFETAHLNHIGLKMYIQKGSSHKAFFKALSDCISEGHIDKAVLIDFQHHNFAVASLLKAHNIPITTFITPNFWLWKDEKKAKRLADYSDDIITIFEKEYAFYTPLHPRVHYFGHPLVDLMQTVPEPSPFKKKKTLVSFFPGSRQQELDLYLPTFSALLKRFRQDSHAHCVVGVSSPSFKARIQKQLSKSHPDITYWEGPSETLLAYSDFLFCASGSATLQAVLHRTPMIVLAALPTLSYWVAKLFFSLDKKIPWVALPNVITGRETVPEYVQNKINADCLYRRYLQIQDPSERASLLAGYEAVIHSMQGTKSIFKALSSLITGKGPCLR
jgi:lipid-A-disaccharide synthase